MNSACYLERFASIVMNATFRDQEAAMKRYLAVCEIEVRIMALAESKSCAVAQVANRAGVSTSTVWRWLRQIEGGYSNHPVERIRWLLPRPEGRKPHPHHTHLHRNSEILSLEEAL